MSPGNGWIRSAELLALLRRHLDASDLEIQRRTLVALKVGLITAKAKVAVLEAETKYDAAVAAEDWKSPWMRFGMAQGAASVVETRLVRTSRELGSAKLEDVIHVDYAELSFNEKQALDYFDIIAQVASASATRTDRSSAGRRVQTSDWQKYAAALAAIAADEGLEQGAAESAIHEKVAKYLNDRGHQSLSLDTTRPAIRRAKAWVNADPFHDDQSEVPPE